MSLPSIINHIPTVTPTPTLPSFINHIPTFTPTSTLPSLSTVSKRELNVTPIASKPGYYKEINYGFIVQQLSDDTIVVTGIYDSDNRKRELTKSEKEIAESLGLVIEAGPEKKEPEKIEIIDINDYSKPDEKHTMFADISLTTTDGIKLYYHRCMLLEYKYFERMLTGFFKESKQEHNSTDIPYEYELSNLLLNILYLEFRGKDYTALIDIENVYEIYSAADMLFLDAVREKCKAKILNLDFSIEWYDFIRMHSIDIADDKLLEKYDQLNEKERNRLDRTKFDLRFWCAYIKRSPKNFNYIWNRCLVYVAPEDFEQAVKYLTKEMFDKESREILANLLKNGNETAKMIIDHYLKL